MSCQGRNKRRTGFGQKSALATLDQHIEALKRDADLAALSDHQRERTVALLELETAGLQKGTREYAARAAQIDQLLQQKWAGENLRKSFDEAQADATKTIEKIDETFHDGFVRMLETGKSSWRSFTDSLRNTFKSEVADEIYKMFARPIVLRFAYSLVGGSVPAGAASAAGGISPAGTSSGPTLLSALYSKTAGGLSTAGYLGLAGLGGAAIGGITGGNSTGSAIGGAAGALGASYLSLVSGTVASAAGAAFGAAAGSIVPVIGTAIGALIGGALGSMIGPKPSNFTAEAIANLQSGSVVAGRGDKPNQATQACRYLVKDFGTSQSPKSTRLRDSH